LKDGYFDTKGNIHERLIVADALDIAQKLEVGRMTRSQLRNFYSEVADVRHLLRLRPDSFEALKSRVLKLQGFAYNATTRSTNKAPQLFSDFIAKNTEIASKDRENFLNGFCEHFECVVLYFKGR
jgi:CRISPR type III-A-associated protein Csm2